MAAFEKICEYSGNYTGYEMYGFKRNHIQVEPKYRKNFRGMKAVLTISPKEIALQGRFSSKKDDVYYQYSYDWKNERDFYDSRYRGVPEDKVSFEKWLYHFFKKKPVINYEYYLEIIDENWDCPTGRTEFYGTTFSNPKHIIRRLRRLVGSKNLVVVKNY